MKRMIGLLMVMGLVVSVVGCGDSDSPTGPSEEFTTWRKTFGEGEGNSVQQTVDGRFIVTGDDEDYSFLLLKTDGQGNEEWSKSFGDGVGYSVQQTVDGGFVVTGYEDDEVFLLKTDGQGNEEWRKTFGEGGGYSVQQTVDGGFIVTGTEGEYNLLLLKTNELGYTDDLEDE